MHDLQERPANRVQLTTDGHKAYLSAVESVFGSEIDYAQLVKIYGCETGKVPTESDTAPLCAWALARL
jgi:hypothetical protein